MRSAEAVQNGAYVVVTNFVLFRRSITRLSDGIGAHGYNFKQDWFFLVLSICNFTGLLDTGMPYLVVEKSYRTECQLSVLSVPSW